MLPTNQGFTTDIAAVPPSMIAKFSAEAGISLSRLEMEILGGDMGPMLEVVWKWEYGKSLVPPDQINLYLIIKAIKLPRFGLVRH